MASSEAAPFEVTFVDGARDGAIVAAAGFAYVGEGRFAAATAGLAFALSQLAYWQHGRRFA